MSEEPTYTVRWKGKEFGPYSSPTIRHKLSSGEFGLMHEVMVHGEWISLERFLNGTHPQANSDPFHDGNYRSEPVAPLYSPKKSNKDESDPYEYEMPPFHSLIIVAGYVCCAASLLIYPQALGMAAFMIGSVNVIMRNYSHGLAQILLSMGCYYANVHYLSHLRS